MNLAFLHCGLWMIVRLALVVVVTKTGMANPVPTPTTAAPYQYSSLKNATPAEVVRYMAEGKSELDREFESGFRNHLPENFWTANPRDVALALLEANRSQEHRAKYRLTLENLEPASPPERCTIAFSYASARCYVARDQQYFLHVAPEDSYLAFVESESGGVVFYSAVHDEPFFDLRFCSLRYEDARRIADVIWWLNRIHTEEVPDENLGSVSAMISTGNGSGKVTVRWPGQPPLERLGTVWSGGFAEYWSGDYEPETFVSFAGYLLREILPARLGEAWSQFEPKVRPDFDEKEATADYTDAERERLHDLATRFLESFSPEQERISFAIVAQAARLEGTFAMESAAARLREIKAAVPPPPPPRRSYEEANAERDRLQAIVPTDHAAQRKKLEDRIAALETEIDLIAYDPETAGSDYLLKSVTQAQRQIEVANDVKALFAWAKAHKPDYQGALRRLAQLDPARYADALESLMRQAKDDGAREFFDALAKAAPERAIVIARRLPPRKKDPLAISAFLLLRNTGAVPDEARRLAVITAIMRDPKADSGERRRAFDVLVPDDEPFRYPRQEIDEAMLTFVNPKEAGKGFESFFSEACRALARRKRTDLFVRMAEIAKSTDTHGFSDQILAALTHLAQSDPARLNPQLAALIRPELSRTNVNMANILWDIWAADVRELEPELERLATAVTEEYEDKKADSAGGDVSPVTGRFHLARQILALWREPDEFTRGRMLTALALAGYGLAGESTPERRVRFNAEAERIASSLSSDAKQQLALFVSGMESDPALIQQGVSDPKTRRELVALVRHDFGL